MRVRPIDCLAGSLLGVVVIALTLAIARPAAAYIEVPYTLGRIVSEATVIVVLEVEKIDKEKKLIIYKKVRDLKGKHPTDVVRHDLSSSGFHPREVEFVMNELEVGKIAVMFHNGSAGETCINRYWYQTYPGGEWWRLVHGEPFLLRSYAGKPEKLIPIVQDMLAGKEVVVPCMADGDKNALHLRTARMQRMRASLKLIEYNEKRDFVGWGQQEFEAITSMPGFSHLGTINRVDPGALGVVAADFDSNGRMGLCLFGEEKLVLLRPSGNTMEEVPLAHAKGARAAAFADVNGDGKPDLLLAGLDGPKLFINEGGKFRDESARLPKESYYNLTAAAFIDADADGRQDILLANGFLGLRLYRNMMAQAPATQPADQPWFQDATQSLALGPNGIGASMKGDHLAVADVNGDGRQDFLYSAGTGLLVLNTPAGFVESKESGLSFQAGQVAPVFADFTGDKAPGLFVPQADGNCKLYRNDGKGHFADITAQAGDLARPMPHVTCALWFDLGGKGRPDLLIGRVKGPNLFFRNNGNATFTDATGELGLHHRIFNTRALCSFDMNKDGVPDLALNNEGQDSAVLLGAAVPPAQR